MPRENKSKYAILGILSFGPHSGYDIKKKIETSTGDFWSESYGQIYPILKRFVDEGLATQSIKPQVGKPDRHVYMLTEKGLKELQHWLTEPVEPHVDRIELLLKLFFGQQTTVVENIRHVEQFQQQQQQLLQKYQAIAQEVKANDTDDLHGIYWLMTNSYKLHTTQALIAWSEETLVKLKQMAELGIGHGA